MPESFGARLRQHRERQGVALAAITRQTGIKEALLEALERDDLSQWPSGFYRRAFFRTYAAAIQLDPDVSLREFQAVHPEPPEVDVLAAMAATLGRGERNAPATALRGVFRSAFSSLSRLRGSSGADAPPPSPAQAPPAADSSAAAVELAAPEQAASESGSSTVEKSSAPTPPEAREAMEAVPDLLEVARLCSELGCVTTNAEAQRLLSEAARVLDAIGLIVWAWNPREAQLEPVLWHGYAARVIAQLPTVRRDDDNATAMALRTAQARVVYDGASGDSALAIPLRTASGCIGVFAVELRRGQAPSKSALAVAMLMATQFAPMADGVSHPQQLPFPRAVNGTAC